MIARLVALPVGIGAGGTFVIFLTFLFFLSLLSAGSISTSSSMDVPSATAVHRVLTRSVVFPFLPLSEAIDMIVFVLDKRCQC